MSIKKNFTVGIMDESRIDEFNHIIASYANISMGTASPLYFGMVPVDGATIAFDITFFTFISDNESQLNKKLYELIDSLNELNADYILMDEETRELLVTVDFGGKIVVNLDKLDVIKPGTYKKIDELKYLKTELGYTKGFKPSFRPIEGQEMEEIYVLDEIIFLISDSSENLIKFSEYISNRVMEINPEFGVEFSKIDPQDF